MPSHMEYVVHDQWQVQNAALPPSAGLQQAIAQHEPFAFAQPGPFDHVVSPSSQPNPLANAAGVLQAMHVGAAFSMPSNMECEAIAQHEPAAIAQHVPFDSVAGPGPGLFQPAIQQEPNHNALEPAIQPTNPGLQPRPIAQFSFELPGGALPSLGLGLLQPSQQEPCLSASMGPAAMEAPHGASPRNCPGFTRCSSSLCH